jgi:hypothetical protein
MKIIKEFITEEEQQTLLDWINSNEVPVLTAKNFTPTETTPRRLKLFAGDSEHFTNIQNKIQSQIGCVPPDGWQGQIFIHEVGTFTRQHTDKNSVRMTLVIQQPNEGGNLIHGGQVYNLPERGLAIYNPKVSHAVGQIKEGTRIVIIFFCEDNQE